MVVLLLTSGISFAAESAVPGDILYRTKVSVNEAILVRTETTIEGRAKMEALRISRRLQEAQSLAEKSRLTLEASMVVQERLDAHTRALQNDLDALEQKDSAAANTIGIEVEATMQAHENVLLQVAERNHEDKIRDFIDHARKVRAVAEEKTWRAESEVLTDIAGKQALDAITKVKLELGPKDDGTTVIDALLLAETDLKTAEDESASAEVRLDKAKSALRQAKEATILFNSSVRLKQTKEPQSSSSSSSSTSSSVSSSTSSVLPVLIEVRPAASSSASSVTSSSKTSSASSVSVSSSHKSEASVSSASTTSQSQSSKAILDNIKIKLPSL